MKRDLCPREERNKEIAKLAHEQMKRENPDAKLGNAYEALSKMAGFKDWNTAKALGVDFEIACREKGIFWPSGKKSAK